MSEYNIRPKTAFFLGLGGAIMIGFVIGFFVLLGIVLKDKDARLIASAPGAAAALAPSTPPPAAVSAEAMAPITDKDWVKGNRQAKVSVVEYSDTECPFCKRFHPTMQQLIKEYPNDVNWVYRHFPLTSLHPKAPKEAEATECAGELAGNDGFWKYLDRLFEVTPANNGLDPAELPKIAEYVGLNKAKFEACLNSGTYGQKVEDQVNDAVAAGGQGTPYSVVVVGDQKIPVSGAVPFTQLKTIIDSVLQ